MNEINYDNNVKKQNSGKGILILIIILLLIVIAFGAGYIVADKKVSSSDNKTSVNDKKDEVKDENKDNDAKKDEEEKKDEVVVLPKPEVDKSKSFAGERTKKVTVNGKDHELLFYFYDTQAATFGGYHWDEEKNNAYEVMIYIDNNKIGFFRSSNEGGIDKQLNEIKIDVDGFKDIENNNSYLKLTLVNLYEGVKEYLIVDTANRKTLLDKSEYSNYHVKKVLYKDNEKIDLTGEHYGIEVFNNYINYLEKNGSSYDIVKYQIASGTLKRTVLFTYNVTDLDNHSVIGCAGQCE